MRTLLTFTAIVLAGLGSASAADDVIPEAAMEVRVTEQAFADAFAARDLERFAEFIHPDAVFEGREGQLTGKDAVLEVWSRYFESDRPPFTWEPRKVLVSPDGRLASSSGPVLNHEGDQVGTFSSTWQRQDDGSWKIILDLSPPCRTD